MRTARPWLLVALVALGAEPLTLATDYSRVRDLRVTADVEIELEVTAFEFKIDDQPVGSPEPGDAAVTLTRRASVLDRELEGEAATPSKVRRTFEELRQENQSTHGEEVYSSEHEGALQGVILELERDDEGEVSCEVVEGDADEELLEGQRLALDLDAFLPGDDVEEEDEWDLDDETIRRGLAMALDARLFAPRDAAEAEEGDGSRGGRGGIGRSLARLEWEGSATLAEAATERDGVECARLHLELSAEGSLPDPRPGRSQKAFDVPAPVALEGSIRASLKGDLFFALEECRPLALELEGELSMDNHFEGERDGRRFSSRSAQSGPWTVTIDVEEDDG
jgi:hypothetical protein